jgi:hypothetical protein
MIKKIQVLLVSVFMFAPALVFAASATGGLHNLLTQVSTLVGRLVPFFIGLALVAFLWGVLRYIFTASGGEDKKEAKMFMVWGIVALAVMVSVWGLVNLLRETLLPEGKNQTIPEIPVYPTTVKNSIGQ